MNLPAIDLTFPSSTIASLFQQQPLDDFYLNDHFSIQIFLQQKPSDQLN